MLGLGKKDEAKEQRKKFGKWLKQKLEEKEMANRELARLSGLSAPAIGDAIKGKYDVTIRFCNAIAEPLEVDPVDVAHMAGLEKKG